MKNNEKIKVVLCTPFLDLPDVIKGGINTWGRYVVNYSKDHCDDVILTPISFDRKTLVTDETLFLKRFVLGIKDKLIPVWQFCKTLGRERPDTVHICTAAGYSLFMDVLLLRYARRKGVQSVIHLHFGRAFELSEKQNWEWKMLKNVCKSADRIAVMNQQTYSALSPYFPNKVFNIPNPLSEAVLERIYSLSDKYARVDNRLLYVGHIYKTKGVIELVSACSLIDDIELVIIGKGEESTINEMKAIANRKGGDWLHFKGEVSHKEVLVEFQKAGMFVFPTYSEGFPNVILEAMASKCPIVSSNVGAIPEILNISGMACGICFAPHNPKVVKDAIEILLNDKAKRDLFVNNAYERVIGKYSMPTVWSELTQLWNPTNKGYDKTTI